MNADNQAEASGAVRQVVQTVAGGMTPGINSLMERTYLFMEDSDFDSAEEYINRVLDIDPKYAPAYVAKVCVAFRIRKESGLADVPFLYEDNSDWQKALRFADSKQRAIYAGYIEKVKPRVAAQIRDYAFDCAVEMAVNPKANREQLERELANYKTSCQCSNGCRANGSRRRDSQQNSSIFQKAVSRGEPGDVREQQLKTAAGMFAAIGDSEGSVCAQNCLVLAEQARLKAIYEKASARRAAIGMPNLTDAADLEALAKQFGQIPGYKDAKQQAEQCLQDAETTRENAYNDAVEAMQEAEKGNFSFKWEKAIRMLAREGLNGYRDVEELRKQAQQRRKECGNAEEKQRQESARRKKTLTIVAVVVVMVACAIAWCIPNVIITNSKYQQALALRENGQYDEAIAVFAELGDYSDAAQQLSKTKYQQAVALRENGQYDDAIAAFAELGDYSDAAQQLSKTKYQQAVALRENGQYDDAIAAFAELGDYSDAAAQNTETKYQQAVSLREAGEYESAIAAFVSLNSYRDAEIQIEEMKQEKYQQAVTLRENGQYDDAIAVFKALGNYSDSKTQITETKYQQANNLNAAARYDEAYAIYVTLTGYKDVDKLLAEDDNMIAAARDAKFAVGNYVSFGTYPQTKAGNDATPIEWLVLARDGNKALLISRYGLDAQPYNKYNASVTWETCTLRTWLNGRFYIKAFSSAEQAAILTTNVDNSKNQCYSGWSTNGGKNTQDKVFLLSYAEANKYFGVTYNSSNTKSRVAPTAYAIAQGAGKNSSYKTADGIDAGWWRLRSPGVSQYYAAYVSTDGSFYPNRVNVGSGSVRPALWVNLESAIF